MSETEQNIIEAQPNDSEGKSDKSKSPKKQQNSNKSGRGLAVLAIIIAAGSLGVNGYLGWQAKNLKQQVVLADENQLAFKAGVEQLQSQIARQQARLNDAITSVQPLQVELEQIQQREERLVSRVDSASRRLKDLEGSSRDQWRLAEVEYLMRLANQRLLMGTDISSSRNLLQSADNILKELDDYSLFPIREALAEDMAMVRAASDFDQETTYLRLQALTGLIPRLQMPDDQRLTMSSGKAAESTGFTPEATTWQDKAKAVLMDTWQQFSNLFRINTQREKPVEALLTAEQEMMIRQNLRLMVEQAKLAVLTREPAIYKSSIEQTQQWITQYFAPNGDVRSSMLAELNELQTISVTTNLPNINRSLEALKSYQSKLETPAPEPVTEETAPTTPVQVMPESSEPVSVEAPADETSADEATSETTNEEPVTQEEPQS